MKKPPQLRKPYGQAKFARVQRARYLSWQDAFEVEFADGLCFLESQAAIKRANQISAAAQPVQVSVDHELGSHFKVVYDTGESAEVSWAFVRELPPAPAQAVAERPAVYKPKRR